MITIPGGAHGMGQWDERLPGWKDQLVDWLKKTLTRFHAGGGVAKDIDNIRYLAQNMLGRTFCPLGDAAAMPTIAFVDKFRKEFEDHLDGKPCPYAKHPAPALAHA